IGDEFEHDRRAVPAERDELLVALAATMFAVERKAHRVEDRRLAGPGGTVNRKQLQRREIDLLPRLEARETIDDEAERAHGRLTGSRTALPTAPGTRRAHPRAHRDRPAA